MCGIAGIIKIHDPKDGTPPPPLEAIPESWLDILDDSIKHRGPDGQGRFRDRATRDDGTIVDVALVHRRLSIIDHEGGHQPMVHDGDKLRPDLTYQPGDIPIIASEIEPNKPLVAVVFNGCIYNHRQLRKELEAAGHVFETDHSDTEVLVHGWREWDAKIRSKLDAMHAHLVWSRSKAHLQSGTDEAGEKPLFVQNNKIATTIFTQVPASFSQLAVYTQTNMLHIDDEFTTQWIMRGTSNSLPAEYGDGFYPRGWGKWPQPKGKLSLCSGARLPNRNHSNTSRFQSADDVAQELFQSVQSRLEADVPIGVFLSGGIDSSLIAAMAMQSQQSPIRTFTIRMPEAKYDESIAATSIAESLGTIHTTLDCDPKPATDLIHLIETSGFPFGDSSLLPTYWVAKAASSYVRVALGGDGADELFGGYRRHLIAQWLDQPKNPIPQTLRYFPTSWIPARESNSSTSDLQRLIESYSGEGYNDIWNIFSRKDIRHLLSLEYNICDTIFYPCPDRLNADYLHYLPDDILRKTDTATMAIPIELRSPFLSNKMVTRSIATPLDILMPNGQRKGLLKQVARKYLPDHIVDRPKQGFAIPIGQWFRSDYGDMRQLLYDHLESTDPFPGLADAGININMKFVNQMLREHDAAGEKSINPWHGRDHSQRLYMLLVLSIWSKWLDRTRREPLDNANEKAHG